MADDICQFNELLQKFLSVDNEQRCQAEETYEGIHIVTKIQLLQQIVENPTVNSEVRTLAAVLLRRQFASSFDELWSQLDNNSQLALKSRLLLYVQNEADYSLRNKFGECIAELARNLIDDDGNNSWPEILKFLFDCASSGNAGLRESALHILSFVPGIFGNQQASYVDVIHQLFHHCLTDPTNEGVRFEAVKACVAFIIANDDDKQLLAHFRSLLQSLLQVIEESTLKQDDDSLLKCLIELAESVPKYLRSNLEDVIKFALKVVSNTEFEDNSRQLALEAIVSLSETAPAMMRKLDSLLGHIVQQALAMMMEQDDDEAWSQADEIDEEDNESNAVAAESALDRIACALGGKTILPLLLPLLVPMLRKSDDWHSRYAALMAISACGEGCHKRMEQMLNDIVEAVLPFLADPHPRVRYAACNALGQMATDFASTFQKKFHQKVVGGLLTVLDDSANPRVQAHAGAALVNFCEDCPKAILSPYLDVIITKLESVLSSKFEELVVNSKKLVLEQIVTTLAAVADAAEEKFTQYYDRFMPVLKYIVENAVKTEHRLLRGKTIECISLIGLAVGAQKFMADCHDVMQLLLKTQIDWDAISDDDPQISYMISAWARICKVMGAQFGQYLPLVMGPVLKAAAMKPEVTLMDNEEAKTMDEDPDWQFVTVGDQKSFGIRTSGLEEKATACQMLVCYARELKEPFAPYVEQVARIVVPHLKFYFHDSVRIAAAECLPLLLACASVQSAEYTQQLWQFICPELIKAIDLEPENSIRSEHMDAFAQCIVHMGKGCLTEEQIKELVTILDRLLQKHFERQEQRQEQRKDEDYDEVVEENLVDEDDEDVYVLSKLSDIVHAFFGTHKEAALPIFDQLLPHFVTLLQPNRPWTDKQWSLCIFDDLVEHAGPISLNYQQYFLHLMIQYVCDEQSEVRQAAAYGIGVIAQFGGPGYAQALNEAIPLLVKVITAPNARVDKNVSPTENCISAISKMCRYRSDVVNVNELVPHWLSWLPVWEDEEEAVHVYNYFCDLIEINHPSVHQNLPGVLSVIADVLRRDIFEANDAVLHRLLAIARQMQTNTELFNHCISQLDDLQKAALQSALSA